MDVCLRVSEDMCVGECLRMRVFEDVCVWGCLRICVSGGV